MCCVAGGKSRGDFWLVRQKDVGGEGAKTGEQNGPKGPSPGRRSDWQRYFLCVAV
ncbi:MAG: DUF1674 domain-containing protein [Chloroflexi bacterium]|nr:DUF1674 domain-containing protein [Chloroflexota bacterium]MBP8059182.1 DUF1674 domain-containing protein [Chloroflexota bacterium]